MTPTATHQATNASRASEAVRLDILDATRAAWRPPPAGHTTPATPVIQTVHNTVSGFSTATSRATYAATKPQR